VGIVDYRKAKLDRKLTNNVAVLSSSRRRLSCGHVVDRVADVSTPYGRPDLYFCPRGCGLSPGRRA
jgi:hypothetical protein